MIILWLCSNFIPWPGVVDTALIGLIIMFLPGIDLLDGKEFIKSVNWDVVMMTGTLIALGGIVQSTGGVAWMVDSLLGDASMWPFLLLVLAMSLVPCIIHIFVPLAGAIYALSLIPLVSVALAAGISPLIPAMMVAIWMNFECILPTDTIFMLTYANGFYEFKDTIKIGIPLTIIVVLLTVVWVPLAAGMLG
jgi:sodium-dependent dicarboxylate transporter 2/3/5